MGDPEPSVHPAQQIMDTCRVKHHAAAWRPKMKKCEDPRQRYEFFAVYSGQPPASVCKRAVIILPREAVKVT